MNNARLGKREDKQVHMIAAVLMLCKIFQHRAGHRMHDWASVPTGCQARDLANEAEVLSLM
jgi:hypothetical protein